jgi:putative membrane protein
MKAEIQRNDKKAKTLIYLFTIVVFLVVVSLKYLHFQVDLGFNVHYLATANAYINATVATLLILALLAVKRRNFELHKKLMKGAIYLSILFLVTYIGHHMFAGETTYGTDSLKTFYYVVLISHIFLAAIILPFILFTAYRALIADFDAHKKLAKITWPIWFYVAVSGVIVYVMISPFYK